MRLSALVPLLSTLLLAGCGDRPSGPVGTPLHTIPDMPHTVVMSGLSSPWDVAVAADGLIFYTEKCRGLSVRHPDGSVSRLFGTSGSSLVATDLACVSQSGVNGVALDPAFATNRTIYVYMLSTSTTPNMNHVVKLVLNAGYTTAGNRTDIVTDIQYKQNANAVAGAGAHSGGRIRFGHDGFLYITTGDNHNPILPQSPTLLGGKVLRVTTTGVAAPGNSPPAGFDPRIYTYGHRNVQGIAFRPWDGRPFIAEHGPNHTDEVTALVNGGNGGWDPENRPSLTCPDNYCGYAGNPTTMPMTDLARFPSAMQPSFTNGNVSQGMGPAVFLEGEQWLSYNGRLAVGFMAGSKLMILEINGDNVVIDAQTALTGAEFRALTLGPDGNLYVATNQGEIWKIVPTPPASG
jgi:glucose/arabinose dehydrogenase